MTLLDDMTRLEIRWEIKQPASPAHCCGTTKIGWLLEFYVMPGTKAHQDCAQKCQRCGVCRKVSLAELFKARFGTSANGGHNVQ